MSPLALMIRPHGSSPHHSLALVLALTAILASKPFPLAHITSSAPSMLIALGGENSYRIASFGSGRDRPVVVLAAPRHQHEDDARDLVGERHPVRLNLYLTVLRSIIPLAHRRKASLWPRRWRSVAQRPPTGTCAGRRLPP